MGTKVKALSKSEAGGEDFRWTMETPSRLWELRCESQPEYKEWVNTCREFKKVIANGGSRGSRPAASDSGMRPGPVMRHQRSVTESEIDERSVQANRAKYQIPVRTDEFDYPAASSADVKDILVSTASKDTYLVGSPGSKEGHLTYNPSEISTGDESKVSWFYTMALVYCAMDDKTFKS